MNFGTMERIKVIDTAKEVLRCRGKTAEFDMHPEMLTGPLNRVADNSMVKKLLGWEPKLMFIDGLHKTIDWYVANRKQSQVSAKLEAALTAR